MLMDPDWPNEVHRFWFEDCSDQDWWTSNPTFDATVRRRFASLHGHLTAAAPESLLSAPRQALAATIVLDQFSRNMFRHTPAAFASDGRALRLAELAIGRGFDQAFPVRERQFLYMPYMHAEDAAAQARALTLFATLGHDDSLRSANEHKAIIDRFGRFPHRNATLGRADTAAEAAYLQGDVKRFGQ